MFKVYPRSCERAREWASLRLDGEVSEFERALLGAHVERCADCARFVHGLEAVTVELRAAEPAQLGTPVALPLRRRRVVPLRAMSGVAAAATVAAAVGLGTLFGSFGTAQRPAVARAGATGSSLVAESALIQEPKLAMIRARIPGRTPQRGLGIAEL